MNSRSASLRSLGLRPRRTRSGCTVWVRLSPSTPFFCHFDFCQARETIGIEHILWTSQNETSYPVPSCFFDGIKFGHQPSFGIKAIKCSSTDPFLGWNCSGISNSSLWCKNGPSSTSISISRRATFICATFCACKVTDLRNFNLMSGPINLIHGSGFPPFFLRGGRSLHTAIDLIVSP